MHWLGYNNTEFIKYFKPTSVDSTTWNNGQKYGRIDIYKGHAKFLSTVKNDWLKQPTKAMISGLKKIGYTIKDIVKLQNPESWRGGSQHQMNKTREFNGLAASVNNRCHMLRSLDIEKNLGTKVYLACGNYQQVQSLFFTLKEINQLKLI